MKKFTGIVLAMLLFVACMFTTACNRGEEGDEWSPALDTEKTQLYVFNFDGGYGTQWLRTTADRFEKDYAETSFEEGKKGVQIMITPEFVPASQVAANIKSESYEVYFVESIDYYEPLAKGWLLDITDTVTESMQENFGEDKSIESKMTKEQVNFYKTTEGKYYGVPHYASFFGIAYDMDIFEEKGFYLSDNPDVNDGFVRPGTQDVKSKGPDGKTGVIDGVDYSSDDGLPATYDEFFKLCARISDKGMSPINWTGLYDDSYLRSFMSQLYADYEGVDQMMLNYTFNGSEATNLVKSFDVDENGAIVNLVTESKTINKSNGYELMNQAGRAYALNFMERIINGRYHSSTSIGASTHSEAQLEFLRSKWGSGGVAMHIDGNFWFSEASKSGGSFELLQSQGFGDAAKPENRNIGFMPFPKATAEQVGEKTTLLDYLNGIMFAKADIPEAKQKLAKLFIQFCNTDKSLREFSYVVNAPKALEYDMGDDYDKMSTYGKSVWNIKANADMLYPLSANEMYANNQSKLSTRGTWYSSVNGVNKNLPINALKEGISAKDYFTGISQYYNQAWWNTQFGAYLD